MKATSIISVTLGLVFSGALLLSASIAYASEVTGQLSSSNSSTLSSSSEVSGTFGGGNSSAVNSSGNGGGGGGSTSGSLSGTVSGSVSGGSSGGGGGGISSLLGNGSGGGVVALGEVLGASTEVPSVPPSSLLTDDSGSLGNQTQGNLALGDESSPTTQANAPLMAAVAASGFGMNWWLWIVLLFLVAAGVYTYWRYYQKRR